MKIFRPSYIPLVLLVLISFGLSSCGSSDMQDLRARLDEIKKKPKGRIPPPPEFKAFETFTYQSAGLRSPFEKPVEVVIDIKVQKGKVVKPDFNRRRQALENFSLDAMAFVGTLAKEKEDEKLYAIIDDGAGGVHRVQEGDYLGQNHGRIINIHPRRVELVEIVPNGQVDDEGNKLWIERPRSLVLRDE